MTTQSINRSADSQPIDALLDKVALAFCRLKAINSVTDGAPTHETLTIQFEEWDWEVGVGLYGFWKLARQRQDSAMLAALEQWYEQKLQAGLPPRQINSTAPMLVLALLCRDNPKPHWLAAVAEWADWLLHSLPKTEDGGFQHTVKERPNTGQLWDDTLFMAGLFLVVSAGVLKRRELLEEAEYQLLTHARYLADATTGLWYHGWTFFGSPSLRRGILGAWQRLGHAGVAGDVLADGFALVGTSAPHAGGDPHPADPCAGALSARVRVVAHAAQRSRLTAGNLCQRRFYRRDPDGASAWHAGRLPAGGAG
ncbi:hypothetical protein OS31_17250 [Dickeya oryzae]